MSTSPTLRAGSRPGATGRAGQSGDGRPPSPGVLVLGRYRLERRLGSGGFGTVWLAFDEHLERPVAVKAVPRASREGRADARRSREARGERTRREAVAAARLNHPGVVTLYESGRDHDHHYLISELVTGPTLAQATADGALSDRDVARMALAVAAALEHAHARGVIHRDVKPQNVILVAGASEPAEVAKLTDFGIAQLIGDEPLTRTGDVVGTLAYMAPEQAEGRRVGAAADLYALGLVLYEALTGTHPVRGRGPADTARRLGAVLPPARRVRRDLPARLAAAIDRAVLPDPRERGSLGDLRRALDAALGSLSDQGGSLALPAQRVWRPRIPGRVGAGLVTGAVAAAAAAVTGPAPASVPVIGATVAVAVALFPRAGWLAAAAAGVGWAALGPHGSAATSIVVAAGLIPVPLALARSAIRWSLPVAAPLLGAAQLAVAYPALAGQTPTAFARAAAGALGAWWLALAALLWGELPGGPSRAPSGVLEALHALAAAAPVAGPPALAFAVASALLPWAVRGRSLAADLIGASVWAVALASAAGACALTADGAGPGAVLGGAAALGAKWIAEARSPSGSAPPAADPAALSA